MFFVDIDVDKVVFSTIYFLLAASEWLISLELQHIPTNHGRTAMWIMCIAKNEAA
jgi:hypothetical protein